MPAENQNGSEWKGATTAQISHLKEAILELRQDTHRIAQTMNELRDFKTKVMAWASMSAVGASLLVSWVLDKFGGSVS